MHQWSLSVIKNFHLVSSPTRNQEKGHVVLPISTHLKHLKTHVKNFINYSEKRSSEVIEGEAFEASNGDITALMASFIREIGFFEDRLHQQLDEFQWVREMMTVLKVGRLQLIKYLDTHNCISCMAWINISLPP
uniref:Uncharacterized protein n=1 Tax=Glossina pallidipes TaxID=7398 RepID=A0A1A9ZPT8_GLOPL